MVWVFVLEACLTGRGGAKQGKEADSAPPHHHHPSPGSCTADVCSAHGVCLVCLSVPPAFSFLLFSSLLPQFPNS